MKNLKRLITLSFLFFVGISSVNAAPLTLDKDDIANDTYIIGKHLFDTNRSSLTTQDIMWAARSIDGPNVTIDDMIIYYKNFSGQWINGLTGQAASPDNTLRIDYINSVEQKEYKIENNVLTILLPGDYTGYPDIDGQDFDDIIISENIGDGEVILSNVTVNGNVYIYGGGSNSVYFKDSQLNNVEVVKDVKPGDEYVRVVFTDGTIVNLVKTNSDSAKIVIGDSSEIAKIEISSPNITIELEEDAVITSYPDVEVKANNVTINIPDLPIENITFDEGVTSVVLNDNEYNAPSTPVLENVTFEETEDNKFVVKIKASDPLYNLYSLEVDHSFDGLLPEFTVYADSTSPYGLEEGIEELYASWGLDVKYDETKKEWTLTISGKALETMLTRENVTFYFVVKNTNGNESGSMYNVTEDMTFTHTFGFESTPVLENVTFEETEDNKFVVKIKASDPLYNLYSLEVDHSFDGLLPEFTVYADSTSPYGLEEGIEELYASWGLDVKYDETEKEWTFIFNEELVQMFKERGSITFYFVVKNTNGNESGSMYNVTEDMTFTYIFEA